MNYNTKYVVRLAGDEREELESLVNRGRVAAEKRRRAQILLKADAGAEGNASWTLRLLADKLVELEVVDTIDKETVRRTLKKTT